MTSPESRPSIGDRLAEALKEAGIGPTELARRIVGPNGTETDVQSWRRAINRYRLGGRPESRERARAISRALGREDDLEFYDPTQLSPLERIAEELGEIRVLLEAVDQRLRVAMPRTRRERLEAAAELLEGSGVALAEVRAALLGRGRGRP